MRNTLDRDAVGMSVRGGPARRVNGVVRVADVDPGLLRNVPTDVGVRLRRHLITEAVEVPARSLVPFTAPVHGVLGVLVLEGLLLRSVSIGERQTAELLGPGDVVRPWQDEGPTAVLPSSSAWTALEATRVAVLDDEFAAAAYRFPGIANELLQRVVERCHALSVRLAIASIPSLPDRLLALLWHLADRWGIVEPGGVRVPLRISHQVLAALACAQRPSVSVALKHLVAAGRVARAGDHRGWVLFGRMPATEIEVPGRPVPALSAL